MIYWSQLQKHGTTEARLKTIFTADRESPDYKHQELLTSMIRGRIQDGIKRNFIDAHHYQAVDIACDTDVISKEYVPLVQYANGSLSERDAMNALKTMGSAEKYVKYVENEKGVKVPHLDIPKFWETTLPVVRSYLNIKRATLTNRYENSYPFFKYEPRTQDERSRLQGEKATTKIDINADQYDYRSSQDQVIWGSIKYGDQIMFPTCVWDSVKQLDGNGKEAVVKEGIKYTTPHPSRVFWDNAYPMYSLLSDTGCNFAGYWDVGRFGDFENNKRFWNRDKINYGEGFVSRFNSYLSVNADYFKYYYTHINFPTPEAMNNIRERIGAASTVGNDRLANISLTPNDYAKDASVIFTVIYMKLVPADYGIGTYNYPIWFRFMCVNEDTVIHAEPIPYCPPLPLCYKPDATRQKNLGIGHELLTFQDKLSNLMSNWLVSLKKALFAPILANMDILDKDSMEMIRTAGDKKYTDTLVIPVSFARLKSGKETNPAEALVSIRTTAGQDYTQIPAIINTLIGQLERMIGISPAETGQGVRRETTGKEITAMSEGSNNINESTFNRIDAFRAAWKRQLLQANLNFADEEFTVAISSKWSVEYLRSLNLEPVAVSNSSVTVKVSKQFLNGDFAFNSKDGADRTSDAAVAQTMLQAYTLMVQDQVVAQSINPESKVAFLQQIAKLSGAGDLEFLFDRTALSNLSMAEKEAFAKEVEDRVLNSVTTLLSEVNKNASQPYNLLDDATTSNIPPPRPGEQIVPTDQGSNVPLIV